MAAIVMTPAFVMAEVERVMSAPWAWGSADCCTAATDVFAALHGRDPMAPVRGRYASAAAACRLIRDWGGFAVMAARLAARARLLPGVGATGEIGLSPAGVAHGPEGRALMICIQPGHWAAKTRDGFAILPAAEWCWRA